jgi:ATP-binding cassette subfamily F protein 3
MIRFQQVSFTRGIKPLLDNVDLTLNPGDKIGLIGANGAGKSSLFGLLRGELHADLGSIDFPSKWRMAYVAQETPALNRPAVEYAIDGDVTLRRLEHQLADLENQPESSANGILIGEAYSGLADADAYTVRSRAEQLLTGLGFTLDQMQQPVASFSGGWRMRLNLAQALMCPSDLLLLDEPTNHLDLDAIIWLEEWLKRYPGTLLIISHDRDFLDGVVNVIVHVDERKLKRYSGNYSGFERQRAAQIVLAQSALEKQTRQRAHLESFIDRFKAQASKARQAQSRMKALSKMEELAPLRAAAEFSFEFREAANAPNPMLVMEDVSAGYNLSDDADHAHMQRPDSSNQPRQKVIVSDINFSLQTGQRIGLLGVNGAGKSTLIKTIASELAPLAGQAQFGKGLAIGYFAQHQVEMLRHEESPLWHLAHIAPTVREQELRNFLGSFNFNGSMVTSKIAPFSGGEKARLALALIVWQRPNLLLLDEPTNHLDLETREALTMALAQFEGTLIVVSHDRHLLRATTDQFIIVADGKLQPFDGDLDDYRDWLFKTKLALKANVGSTANPKANSVTDQNSHHPAIGQSLGSAVTLTESIASLGNTGSANNEHKRDQKRLDAQERQKLAAKKKPIEAKIKQLEDQIGKRNSQKTAVETKLADPAIYETNRKAELKSLMADQSFYGKELSQLEAQWLELQEALEQVTF